MQVYASTAKNDGVSLDTSPHGVREFMMTGLAGAYRRVVHRPDDLAHSLVRYDNQNCDLASTGLEGLDGRQTPAAKAGSTKVV